MGFSFSSFLGGAATSIGESIDKYEKEAAKNAEIQLNLMTKNFTERKTELDTLRNSAVEDAKFVAGLYSTEQTNPLFEDMVFAVTQNPAALARLKKASTEAWFDPTKITLASLYKPLKQEASGQSAVQQIDKMYDINNAVQNTKDIVLSASNQETKNPLRALGAGNADAKARNLLSTVAKSLGTTPEQMAGAMQFKRPVAQQEGTFDYAKLRAPMTWDQTKGIAFNDMSAALNHKQSVYDNPDSTPEAKQTADRMVKVAESTIKNIKSVESVLDTEQVKYANELYAAKRILISDDATPQEKKEAQAVVNKAKTMDQTATQQLQDQIANLTMTVANSKDPAKVQQAQSKLDAIYEAQNKQLKNQNMPTFDQFRKLVNDRIKNELDANFAQIGNVQFDIDGTARFKGDETSMLRFNAIKQNAVKAVAATYADPSGRMLNPIYGALVDAYLVPRRPDGSFELDVPSGNRSAQSVMRQPPSPAAAPQPATAPASPSMPQAGQAQPQTITVSRSQIEATMKRNNIAVNDQSVQAQINKLKDDARQRGQSLVVN